MDSGFLDIEQFKTMYFNENMEYELVRDFLDFKCFGVNNTFAHYHKSIEFVYAVEGDIVCNINGVKETVKEGELLLIPPYYSHSYFAPNNEITEIFCLTASSSDYYFDNIITKYHHELVLKNKKVAKEIINILNELSATSSSILRDSTYRYCLAKFVENVNKKSSNEQYGKRLFFDIIEYINAHYKENISLESIATHFNYSKCYFSSLFNSLFNQSLSDFLNVVRIQNAIEILNAKTVTEIAYEVGYRNLQSFFYNFKKIVGCAPKEYSQSPIIMTK